MRIPVEIAMAACLLTGQQCLAADGLGDLLGRAVERAAGGKLGGAGAEIVRSVTGAANGGSTAAPNPTGAPPGPLEPLGAGGKPPKLENGETFYPQYIVDYWNQPGASTRGDDPSSDAPGHVNGLSTLGGDRRQPGAADMRRKLERITARLMEHPGIKDPHGASISVGGGFYREKGGPSGPAVAAHLSIKAFPINLNDKATRRFPDGTYATEGGNEADDIRIEINDPDVVEGRTVLGTYNGLTLVRRHGGYMFVIPNTAVPLIRDAGNLGKMINSGLLDPSRPAADIQFMTVYVGTSSNRWSDIVRRREKPTSTVGRLIGVMFTTDWQSLLREVN